MGGGGTSGIPKTLGPFHIINSECTVRSIERFIERHQARLTPRGVLKNTQLTFDVLIMLLRHTDGLGGW